MNNSAHLSPRTLAQSLASDRPRASCELDRCDGLSELCSAPGLEELVGSPEARERVLQDRRQATSNKAATITSEGSQVPQRSRCGILQRRLLQPVLARMNLSLPAPLDL